MQTDQTRIVVVFRTPRDCPDFAEVFDWLDERPAHGIEIDVVRHFTHDDVTVILAPERTYEAVWLSLQPGFIRCDRESRSGV